MGLFIHSMKYSTIEDYIDRQLPENQPVFEELYRLILNASHLIQGAIMWNTPYFYHRGGVCYFSTQKKVPYLAFVHGNALLDEAGLLESKERKQVKSISLPTLQDLQKHLPYLQELLQEALLWNEQYGKVGKKW